MFKGIKQGIGIALGVMLTCGVFAFTVSGSIKTWSAGETLTHTDLNQNVQSLKAAIEAASQLQSANVALSSETRYLGIMGTASNTESDVQYTMPRSGVVKGLAVKVTGTSCTVPTQIVLRDNGVDTSLSYSVPSGTATGLVTVPGSYSYSSGAKLTWKTTCTNGTSSINAMYEY